MKSMSGKRLNVKNSLNKCFPKEKRKIKIRTWPKYCLIKASRLLIWKRRRSKRKSYRKRRTHNSRTKSRSRRITRRLQSWSSSLKIRTSSLNRRTFCLLWRTSSLKKKTNSLKCWISCLKRITGGSENKPSSWMISLSDTEQERWVNTLPMKQLHAKTLPESKTCTMWMSQAKKKRW